MKRLLACLLALLMIIGLAACGTTTPSSSTDTGTKEAEAEEVKEDEPEAEAPEEEGDDEEDEEELGELDLSEEATVILYQIGDEPQDLASVLEVLNEKLVAELNTKLDVQFSTWVDYKPKYSNILTTTGADMCYAASWLDYALYSKEGAFVDVEPLMKAYAPDLWNWIGESKMSQMKVGDTIYGIPNMWDEYVMIGIAYRKDLADKYEVPYPESFEKAEQYFQGVHEADPDQEIIYNGASDASSTGTYVTTGSSLLMYKYPEGICNKYGYQWVLDDPANLWDYWYSDEFVEDAKLMKKWCDAGWWSRSCLNAEADQEALQNNRCIAFISGCNANKYCGWVNDVKDKEGWELGWWDYAENTGYAFPVHPNHNLTCIINGTKYADRCVKVIEYLMMDEEANKLIQCGIEGKHYTIDADGLYNQIEDSGYGYEACDTWQLRNADFKLTQPTGVLLQKCFDREKEIALQREKYPDINIVDSFAEDYSGYNAEMAAVQNVIGEKLNPIFAGLVDDPEAAIAEFRTLVEAAGLETIRADYNKQWTDYCAANGFE
ncbi:MAG: extracellular solute-binding protein [Lachnospiraceae bacterium]|nr:extracellular solute-binding protein [Lachnospiraceae bacterium]